MQLTFVLCRYSYNYSVTLDQWTSFCAAGLCTLVHTNTSKHKTSFVKSQSDIFTIVCNAGKQHSFIVTKNSDSNVSCWFFFCCHVLVRQPIWQEWIFFFKSTRQATERDVMRVYDIWRKTNVKLVISIRTAKFGSHNTHTDKNISSLMTSTYLLD